MSMLSVLYSDVFQPVGFSWLVESLAGLRLCVLEEENECITSCNSGKKTCETGALIFFSFGRSVSQHRSSLVQCWFAF